MTKSRTIGRTRRQHWTWLQRALIGSRRWRADCRCGWRGPDRRFVQRALLDGAEHAAGLNRRQRAA
jgi:hypothetical protein